MTFLKIKNFSFFLFLTLFILKIQAQDTSRSVLPMNADWSFVKSPEGTLEVKNASWETVSVPHSWNQSDMHEGEGFYEGVGLYKKIIKAPETWSNKRVFIKFKGVGHVTDVYINNIHVGQHKGSFSAFIFDISPFLKFGETNTILVKADNTAREDVIPVNHNLFGIYGGIYRQVELIVTGKLNITTTDYASSGVYIKQKNVTTSSADIQVETKLENTLKKTQNVNLKTTVYNNAGEIVAVNLKNIMVYPQGRQSYYQTLVLKKPHLWQGIFDPYLYKVKVVVSSENGEKIDEVTQKIGLRTIEIIAGKGLFLNGKKYPMYGVNRHQDLFKHGNALTKEQENRDIELIKEVGATTVRLAHYQQSDHFYTKCDSVGFLVWAEIPFVNQTRKSESDNAKLQISELIKQNFNHSSIYIWGTYNEVWAKTTSDYAPVLIRDLHDLAKTLDPDRYTVGVSGKPDIENPNNLNTDVHGNNRYFGWYQGESAADLKPWLDNLKNNYPDFKVILSEYGAGSNIFQQAEVLPDKIDPKGQFFPESYANRLHETQWGIINDNGYLIGSYVWNMFDFGLPLWSRGGITKRNHKGLITFDRKNKKDVFYWYKANWNPEPMIYISDRRLVNRTQAETDIHVYCNVEDIELYVNGTKIKSVHTGATKVHYIYKGVALKKGKNKVVAKAKDNGEIIEDKVVWNLKKK
ncbi:beta-galactosidase [Cellulophaga sp. 20_2_10]|uniref:glycoside hydrolase family 2 protein n=1 Tax=Cellulophaga sp. 20_2_10 TaxID=2942476 RepID=UPI00201B1A75|nr:glycoside hydrolase family 2 TIM barrel-domain containing protein [Cellulophaga sp. 20_2_10]MCL5245345.1 beta-galactosidase [Cellulophaga sp. 20_2_10]